MPTNLLGAVEPGVEYAEGEEQRGDVRACTNEMAGAPKPEVKCVAHTHEHICFVSVFYLGYLWVGPRNENTLLECLVKLEITLIIGLANNQDYGSLLG